MTLSQTQTRKVAKALNIPVERWPNIILGYAMDNHKFLTTVRIVGTATIINRFGLVYSEKHPRIFAECVNIMYYLTRCN